jgi:hypothetical protein
MRMIGLDPAVHLFFKKYLHYGNGCGREAPLPDGWAVAQVCVPFPGKMPSRTAPSICSCRAVVIAACSRP